MHDYVRTDFTFQNSDRFGNFWKNFKRQKGVVWYIKLKDFSRRLRRTQRRFRKIKIMEIIQAIKI